MADIPDRRPALEEKFERERQEEEKARKLVEEEAKRKAEEETLRIEALKAEIKAKEKQAEREGKLIEREERAEIIKARGEAEAEEKIRRQEMGLMTRVASDLYSNRGRTRPLVLIVLSIIIILGIIGIYLYSKGWLTAVLVFLVQRGLPIVSGILFAWIIVWGFRDKDTTSKWIAFAFLIWAIDMLPSSFFGINVSSILGPPYAGFEFDLKGTLNTNWVAVITSVVFIIIILFGLLSDIIRRNYMTIPLYFLLIIVIKQISENYLFINYRFPLQGSYFNYIIFGIIVITFVLAYRFRDRARNIDFYDLPSYLFMALVISFFTVNDGWFSNRRAWIHVIYIFLFGLVYIRKQERNNPSSWHLWIPFFLIADFYFYNFIWLFSNNIEGLQFIPILVVVVIIYCLDKTETNYAVSALVFILIIMLVSVIPAYAIDSGSIEFKAKRGATLSDFTKQFTDKVKEIIEGRLDIATGGLYRGSVEKNRYESLGVYFSNLRAADPRFYDKESITVWGTIRSKTYKDAVVVNFSCYRWKDNKKIRADKIIPDIKFPIFTLEEVDTECVFNPSKETGKEIPVGSNIITFSAEYNFGTDAYLKTYFIDRDRFRAYAREDVDILKEFGIKDRNPVAIYTNGPVEIGVSTGDPLITVSEGYAIKPSIGITLTNRQEIQDKDKKIITRWEGKIKNITELVLLVPPGVMLKDIESCKSQDPIEKLKCPCSKPFEKYDLHQCFTSCSKQVLYPCDEACKVSNPNEDEKNKCTQECVTTFDKCNDECNFLFQVDEGEGPTKKKYEGYALDVGSLEFRDLNKDIDKHRSFLCRFDPSPELLDTTPITTRYFRVRARYNYLLENSVTVNVEATPVQAIELIDPEIVKSNLDAIKQISDIYLLPFSNAYLSAIQTVETGMRHCCQESGKNKAGNCIGTKETRCEPDRIITSYDGSSIGIMQINVKYHANEVSTVCGEGKDLYDRDCNQRMGAFILRKYYDKFKYGIKPESLAKFCSPDQQPVRYAKYKSYQGIKAAIRAYNGWGCSSKIDEKCRNACKNSKDVSKCTQNCIDGTVNYVERVISAAKSIHGIEIIDPYTLKSLSPTDEKPAPIREIEDESSNIEPATGNPPNDIYNEYTDITP